MPCTPEELRRLAEIGADQKVGESTVTNIQEQDYPVGSPGVAEAKRRMGIFGFARIQRGAFGPEFSATVLNSVTRATTGAMNYRSKQMGAFMDAIAEPFGLDTRFKRLMGISHEQDTMLAQALEKVDKNGNFSGPPQSLPENVIQAAKNVRKVYNEMFKEAGIDPDLYIQGYRRLIREKPRGLFWDPNPSPEIEYLRGRMNLSDIQFYAELERKGGMLNIDPTASAGFKDYVEGLVRAKKLKPFFEQIEKERVNPFFDVNIIRQGDRYLTKVNDATGYKQWLEMRDHIFGTPTNIDRQMAYSIQKGLDQFGVQGKVEPRHIYSMTQALTNLFYGGVLGSPLGTRPASLVRHMFRLVPTFSEFGAKDTLEGMRVASTPGSWQRYVDRGIITSPLEGIHEQINLARSAGRIISQGTSAFLKVFDMSDRWIRVATAGAAEARFNRALEEGIDSLKGRREIKSHVIDLVKKGQIDHARDEFVTDAVANLQYIYGRANRPQIFRGALGQFAGVLMAYPMNLAEMYAGFGQRAVRGVKGAMGKGPDPFSEAMPLIRQVAFVSAAMMAGSQMLNADLSSIFLHGAFPEAMPGVTIPIHAYQAGRTAVKWGVGNIFMTGETDFQKAERMKAFRETGRDLANFVPGSLFGREVYNVIDDPSFQNIAKHMGFNPLAADANAAAREKARTRAQEKRLEGFPKIKGLSSE